MPANLYEIGKKLEKCHDNFCIMNVLFDEELLPIERSELLYKDPPPIECIRFKKLEGLLLGTAIGDALGVKFEGKPKQIFEKFEIKGYHPSAHITDDTQLTFWTLEVLLEHGWFNPRALAKRYLRERIRGIGHTVKSFIRNYKDLKVPWYLAGVKSAGNGALMKLSPVIIPHLVEQSKKLWSDAVVTTYLIYNDRLAISSAVAFTSIFWELMKINHPPEPEWWLEEYLKVGRELEGDKSNYSMRFGEYKGYRGPAWYFIEKVLTEALKEKWSLRKLDEKVGSGAYLLETIPMVLYSLMLYADKPFEALVESVSNSKDCDTIGAIVGSIIGALHGVKAFPSHLL
ncbi:MAG: ADP-ribosylglycohydrolase family protein, partial [Archaeoglobales archaeon]|nr:ADP-ribosylglycohydrolase family protein [Archaeoglobales archaeon]